MEKEQLIELAQKEWVQQKDVKFSESVIKQIFPLVANRFAISFLESMKYLEKYLWPSLDENSGREHLISIVIILNEKLERCLMVNELAEILDSSFDLFFKKTLDLFVSEDAYEVRQQFIVFLMNLLRHVEIPLFRENLFKVLNVDILSYTSEQSRNVLFRANSGMGEYYKKICEGEVATFNKIIPLIVRNFRDEVRGCLTSETTLPKMRYIEHVLALLNEILSASSTRRFVRFVIEHFGVGVELKKFESARVVESPVFNELISFFWYFYHFPFDETGDIVESREDLEHVNEDFATKLRKLVFKSYGGKVQSLSLVNQEKLFDSHVLGENLKKLSLKELNELCGKLNIIHDVDVEEEDGKESHERLVNSFIVNVDKKGSNKETKFLDVHTQYADESDIGQQMKSNMLLPKASLQFLSQRDLLMRMFVVNCRVQRALHARFLEYNTDFLYPHLARPSDEEEETVCYRRKNRNSLGVKKFKISSIGELDSEFSSGEPLRTQVFGSLEVELEKGPGADPRIREHWQTAKQDDIIYLVRFSRKKQLNQQKLSIECVRGCRVLSIVEDEGEIARNVGWNFNYDTRIIVEMDRHKFARDSKGKNLIYSKPDFFDLAMLIQSPRTCSTNLALGMIKQRIIRREDLRAFPQWAEGVLLGTDCEYDREFPDSPLVLRVDGHLISDVETLLKWIEAMPDGFVVDNKCTSDVGPLKLTFARRVSDKMKENEEEGEDEEEGEGENEEIVLTLENDPQGETDVSIELTDPQQEACFIGSLPGITFIDGGPCTGKTTVVKQIIKSIRKNFPWQRTLLLAQNQERLDKFFQLYFEDNNEDDILSTVRLLWPEDLEKVKVREVNGIDENLIGVEKRLENILEKLRSIVSLLNEPDHVGFSVETSVYFFNSRIIPRMKKIRSENLEFFSNGKDEIFAKFPLLGLFKEEFDTWNSDTVATCLKKLDELNQELTKLQFIELIKSKEDRYVYLRSKFSDVVACTTDYFLSVSQRDPRFVGEIDNVIMFDATSVSEINPFVSLLVANGALERGSERTCEGVIRIILTGSTNGEENFGTIESFIHGNKHGIFHRLSRVNLPYFPLEKIFSRRSSEIVSLFAGENEFDVVPSDFPLFKNKAVQFVNVGPFKGVGENTPWKYDFIQNVGEAEFVVQMFMFMRLQEIKEDDIIILTETRAQKKLVKEILRRRCRANPVFNLPRVIQTIHGYAKDGRNASVVLVSLVRTSTNSDNLRTLNLLRFAFSRADNAVLVFYWKEFFEKCFSDFFEAFPLAKEQKGNLEINIGGKMSIMENLQSFGKIVHEMTQRKMIELKEKQEAFFRGLLKK